MVEINENRLNGGKDKNQFSLKRDLSLRFKRIMSFVNKVHFNVELQNLYDKCDDSLREYESAMQAYVINNGGFLATGVCSYFNDQVDRFGLANIRVSKQDTEDARSIQKYFGDVRNYGDNGVKMIYTVLPGEYEIEYGRQPFPAGIYEDVFQFSASHDYEVLPIVGESEVDYYCRNLEAAIDRRSDFPIDKKKEVLETARRLATKFCVGDKNRIYLIPIDNILNNKASFSSEGIRDSKLGSEALHELDTFEELTNENINSADLKNNRAQTLASMYLNPNFYRDSGLPIFGDFSNKGVTYFEIERKFSLMQKKARDLGYVDGEEIPNNILNLQTKPSTK